MTYFQSKCHIVQWMEEILKSTVAQGGETTTHQQLFMTLHLIWRSSSSSILFWIQCRSPGVTAKTFFFLFFVFSTSGLDGAASLLQDGQLSRFEEGLHHPHGVDVDFSVHHDLLFLQEVCTSQKKQRKLSKSVRSGKMLGKIGLLTIYFLLELVQWQQEDFHKLCKQRIKGLSHCFAGGE